MTLSCEALTENTKVDNSKSNETSTASQKPENSEEQSSFENKTIQFGKKLEMFYSLSDSIQMSLKQAKEQLMVSHFYVANMPSPSNTQKDTYQAYVDTVKCQINDAKQVHNIFKDLSNKL